VPSRVSVCQLPWHAGNQVDERPHLLADVDLFLLGARDSPVRGVDERDRAVGRHLLLAEDRGQAVGPHAGPEREPHVTIADDRYSDHDELPLHARHLEQVGDHLFLRGGDRLRPARRERGGDVDVGLRGDRDDAPGQIREHQRRPVRLADDEPARKAVERGNVGHIERVQRAEHLEGLGGGFDLGVDRDRDGPGGRDVLTIDVGELSSPGALQADRRQHTERRDD
jgi:hypothetical protein